MIPLDGKIISGETTVDEATITGEPIPKTNSPETIYLQGLSTKIVSLKWNEVNFLSTPLFQMFGSAELQQLKATPKFIQRFSNFTPQQLLQWQYCFYSTHIYISFRF
jgi:Cd2+/Zn2+-exporting ATPase